MNFQIDDVWHTIIPVIAAISAIVAAGAALVEFDIKRIIAYSTVSQIGFILLGLSSGNKLAAVGGLLYILMHGLAKGGLFLCAGIIEQNTKTKDIREMGGLITKMPITAVAFLACAFSVMGIPPFGGFFSKYMVIAGAASADKPYIAITFIVGAILTVIYLFRLFALVFLGTAKQPDAREGGKPMLVSVVILSVLSLLGGILIYYPASFVEAIVNQIGGTLK
jgi:formate hydrogenlyase subunit 3/multisubunit Na+/H+ antiporter MnhD subunit